MVAGLGDKLSGYYCKICDCTLRDSITYLDHINGRKRKHEIPHVCMLIAPQYFTHECNRVFGLSGTLPSDFHPDVLNFSLFLWHNRPAKPRNVHAG